MRKRGLPYVLAAMMLIGSTGIGGNYVRADEPAVTEEGEIETTETEEPIEEVTEGITEEVMEEVTEESTEKITEDSVEDITEESYIITGTDEEDSPSPHYIYIYWYKDYDYELTLSPEPRLILKKYKGTDTELYIPATFSISGTKYKVYLTSLEGEYDELEEKYFGKSIFDNGNITKITFGEGFELPEDSSCLFSGCSKLKSIVFEGVDTSNVKNMSDMFLYCGSLENFDFSILDTSNVTDMSGMFWGARIDNLDLSSFDTRKVENFDRMFLYASIDELNISNFDFSSVSGNYETLFGEETRIDVIYTPRGLTKTIGVPDDVYWYDSEVYDSSIGGWAWDDPDERHVNYYDSTGKRCDILPKGLNESIRIAVDPDLALGNGWASIRGKWIFYVEGKPYKGKRIIGKGTVNGETVWWVADDNGKRDYTFTGIARKNTNGHLRFARNGVMDLTFTGLALDPQNHWRFVRNGAIDSSFTGIAQNTNGKWYYCKKGRIDTSFTNMIAKNTNGKYHYCLNGRPTAKFNGIAYCPEVNNWYYCTNGKVDFKFSGKVAPCTNGSLYYVTKSRIDRSFTGIAPGTDGKKYYVFKGEVDRTYSGTVTYQGKKYKVVKGVVK